MAPGRPRRSFGRPTAPGKGQQRGGEPPFFYLAMVAHTNAKRPPLHAGNVEKLRYKKEFGGTTTGRKKELVVTITREKAASAQRLAAFN